MNDARFWDIIARSAAGGIDQDARADRLRAILDTLSVADIEAYQAAYEAKLAQIYSWDLWGAAYVIGGGISDEGFEYFRNWLIAQGRATFEAVLADPDSLAGLIPANARGPLEFEDFGYVALDAWAARTGRKTSEMPTSTEGAAIAGTPWTEDAATLAKRYPRLWQRFGHAPLR